MALELEIVVGTYEGFLVGYKFNNTEQELEKYSLTHSFAIPGHTASVRCVASSGKYLVSGGADDKIIVYDMSKRSVAQILMHHHGTVNTLEFDPKASHLISGGDDGLIALLRTSSWEVEKKWPNNELPINSISVHPSGKLALSIGNDLILRTWNLIKGRLAYATNLNSKPALGKTVSSVKWSLDGNYFAIAGFRVVEIYSVDSAKKIKSLPCAVKPIVMNWVNDTQLLVGLDDGKLIIFSTDNNIVETMETKHGRIKDLKLFEKFVATITSEGEITLWELCENSLKYLSSINIGCRPICLTLLESNKLGYVEPIKIGELLDSILEKNEKLEISEEKIISDGIVTVEQEFDDENMLVEHKTPKRKSQRKNFVADEIVGVEDVNDVEKQEEDAEEDDDDDILKNSEESVYKLKKIKRNKPDSKQLLEQVTSSKNKKQKTKKGKNKLNQTETETNVEEPQILEVKRKKRKSA